MAKDRQPHIGIFGRRNYGKSTLINLLAGQEVAIVSDVAGTTTDPVKKSFEITGFGPVVLIDTAGYDDKGELGQKRIEKTEKSVKLVDLAILLVSNQVFDEKEQAIINSFKDHDVPFIIIYSKSDLSVPGKDFMDLIQDVGESAFIPFNKDEDVSTIVHSIKKSIPESAYTNPSLLGDIVKHGDIVLLITPIDIEAPEGRLILPQVQAIRDVIDNDAVCIVLKEREVDAFLHKTKIKPALAITDSQVFLKADASIPKDIPLTSFSIMLARFKGDFANYLNGTPEISNLKDGDHVLLLESCTHHVSCNDIGRSKIPRWISNFTGKQHHFDVVSGFDNLPQPIGNYSLVIQCGGCVISRKQLINRLKPAIDAGIPVTNYGMAIAYVLGIYQRAVAPFVTIDESSIDYL
ncbi:[FeFe] hydrogenase H-cluster maturation GTPase HydF [Plebeiibacterium sediminum]|uniref:[FeFe] hydrogenase H-cluster maturation GTPase HydF n=1 Tax=Plebeiibacterium sediminum TaxID=2992112 RepID=A0AAE3SE74_9BACT|nr:[FeFe] hydrogenase H-cluster maturation GTPase HydF [Plebeiobacterium sediminum]MCW3786105.1 [FeFe] hydrogenase H-cluster maturation GTPase HydF [Plebeiobacterium sediminum]